jgi:hypothetical protein
MSEEKQSFMQQLDAWADREVVMPLLDPADEAEGDAVIEKVHKAIRAKVLESYRNGQAAGPAKPKVGSSYFRKDQSYAQANTR